MLIDAEKKEKYENIYLKWQKEILCSSSLNSTEENICKLYHDFLKKYLKEEEIEEYLKAVNEPECLIFSLRNYCENISSFYQIETVFYIPASSERESVKLLENKVKGLDYKINKVKEIERDKKLL